MSSSVTNYSLPDLAEFDDLASRYSLGYETMRDVVEVAERVVDDTKDLDPDFAFKASLAAFLAPLQPKDSLDARCALVENMSPDDIQMLSKYSEVVTNFGVSESTNIRCKDCGASTRVQISFDALKFLLDGK